MLSGAFGLAAPRFRGANKTEQTSSTSRASGRKKPPEAKHSDSADLPALATHSRQNARCAGGKRPKVGSASVGRLGKLRKKTQQCGISRTCHRRDARRGLPAIPAASCRSTCDTVQISLSKKTHRFGTRSVRRASATHRRCPSRRIPPAGSECPRGSPRPGTPAHGPRCASACVRAHVSVANC